MITPLFILVIYIEGILACFSPCGLATIPTFLSYLTGFEKQPWRALTVGLLFTIGLAITSALLGALAAAIGVLLAPPLEISYAVLGVVMIVCGIVFLTYIQRYVCKYRPIDEFSRFSGIFGAFLLGLTFGLVLNICATPILGAVLTLIALNQSIPLGFGLLFVFGFGLGTPLIIASPFVAKGHDLLSERYMTISRWLSRIAGIILIILGVDLLLPLFGFPTIIFRLLGGAV